MCGSVPAASEAVSVVVGPIEVRDVSKAAELLAVLRAVRDGALSEGRVSEYDVYVTNIDGVVCNDENSSAPREAGHTFYAKYIQPKQHRTPTARILRHWQHSAQPRVSSQTSKTRIGQLTFHALR